MIFEQFKQIIIAASILLRHAITIVVAALMVRFKAWNIIIFVVVDYIIVLVTTTTIIIKTNSFKKMNSKARSTMHQ